MKQSTGFRLSVGFLLYPYLLAISLLPLPTSATSTAIDGNEVTPSEVSSDRTHYRTGGGIAQPLRIAAVEVEPFFSRELTPSGDSFSGYLVDVVREMSRIAPFQFEWVVVEKDDGHGRKRKNGNSFTELTGKLINGMADVIVLPLDSSNQIQTRRFSHTTPFLSSTLSLLLRAQETPSDHRTPLLETLLNTSDHSRPGFAVTSEGVALELRTQNLSLYQRIWGDAAPSEVVVPLEDGLRRARQRELVLVVGSTEAEYHSSREPCDLVSKELLNNDSIGYVFATRRNGTLSGLLGDVLERIRERDFLDELYRKWWDTDECSPGRGEAERDDHDLEMERIFFTSPVKFFKSAVPPQVTLDGPRSGSLVTVRSTQLGAGPGEPSVNVHTTVLDITTKAVSVGWHGSRDGGQDRATPHSQPLSSSQGLPRFDSRLQESSRRPQRRSRAPKQTTVPLRTQAVPTRTHPRAGFETQGPSSRAERTREPSGHGGWSEGRDPVHNSRQQKGSYTAVTPVQHKTTKSARDIARDFDWVFVTELPRSDDEFDYEIDDDDDDEDYHEQRITVRVVETKPRERVRGSNAKETSVKWDAKPSRKSNDKSSSKNIVCERLLTLTTGFAALLIYLRFSI